MNLNKNLSNAINFLLIFLFSVFVIWLGIRGELDFYVHPRYETFSLAFAGITFFVSLLGVSHYLYSLFFRVDMYDHEYQQYGLEQAHHIHTHTEVDHPNYLGYLLIVLPLLPAFLLPVAPLQSITAQQRELDLNNINQTATSIASIDIFSRNSVDFSFEEWLITIQQNPDLEQYVGDKIRLSGFIFRSEVSGVDEFLLARFQVTCCAVDARPVGIYVIAPDWEEEYQEDDWLEVSGEFATIEIVGRQEPAINPTEIKRISVPNDPYLN
ncbi:MAG: TIGR03943 family putative permease subunit [Candidatus Dojkabacteria bacterium]